MKFLAILLIKIYQGVHLAFFRGSCRFHPSCSEYSLQAIEAHGLVKGIMLGGWRILRCQPFAKGGWDPVPVPTEGWSAFLPVGPRRPLPAMVRMRTRSIPILKTKLSGVDLD